MKKHTKSKKLKKGLVIGALTVMSTGGVQAAPASVKQHKAEPQKAMPAKSASQSQNEPLLSETLQTDQYTTDVSIKDYVSPINKMTIEQRISVVSAMHKFSVDEKDLRPRMVDLVTSLQAASKTDDQKEIDDAAKNLRDFLVNNSDMDPVAATILTDAARTPDTDRMKYILGDISYNAVW